MYKAGVENLSMDKHVLLFLMIILLKIFLI